MAAVSSIDSPPKTRMDITSAGEAQIDLVHQRRRANHQPLLGAQLPHGNGMDVLIEVGHQQVQCLDNRHRRSFEWQSDS
jgi:hypothetical protein